MGNDACVALSYVVRVKKKKLEGKKTEKRKESPVNELLS